MFRLIGGENKGAKLLLPPSDITRPTSNRAREALFNCLFSMDVGLTHAHILDGFAGSGAIGLECLSRGASSCIFVEKHHPIQKIIHHNLQKIQKTHKSVVVETFEESLRKTKHPFDLIYLDPPYDVKNDQGDPLYVEALHILMPHVAEHSVVVIETRSSEDNLHLKDIPLIVHTQKTYGMVRLWFLKKENSA